MIGVRRHRLTVQYTDDLPSPPRLQLLRRTTILDGDLPVVREAHPWEASEL